jgi:hypothetical protein
MEPPAILLVLLLKWWTAGRAMAQAVCLRHLTAECCVHFQVTPSGICCRQIGNVTRFLNIIPPVLDMLISFICHYCYIAQQ